MGDYLGSVRVIDYFLLIIGNFWIKGNIGKVKVSVYKHTKMKTPTHLICEVNHMWAWVVQRWVTTSGLDCNRVSDHLGRSGGI